VYIGHFGNHKWGYSEASLKAFVRQFAIEPEEVSLPGLNIRLVGKKLRNLSVSETDMLPIYSHANKFGPGPDVVTFAEARQKIQEYENNLQTTDTEVGSIQ
jgi:hypothetical protein